MHRWRSPDGIVVFDAADLSAESNHLGRIPGGVVVDHGGWHKVAVNGEVRVSVQLVPHDAAPAWPVPPPQRIYVDLRVDDADGGSRRTRRSPRCGGRIRGGARNGSGWRCCAATLMNRIRGCRTTLAIELDDGDTRLVRRTTRPGHPQHQGANAGPGLGDSRV
jgi:hypothetical protein